MRGSTGSDQGGIRMRMRMDDAAPFCSADILRRKSCDSSFCGSAEAHASLRRFAEGYSFGNTANLGIATSYQRVERESATENITQVQPSPLPLAPSVTSPLTSSETHATCINPLSRAFGYTQNVQTGEDFKSRADACSSQQRADWERTQHDCQTPPRHWKTDLIRERDVELERTVLTDRCEKGRKRHERGALVFGEHAARTPLPVRERIERRAVPKRLRGTMGVDALAVMIEDVLATDRFGKRLRCKVGEDRSIADEDKWKEKGWNTSDDSNHTNHEGANENDSTKDVTNRLFDSQECLSNLDTGILYQPKSASTCVNGTSARRGDDAVAGDIDDDGTTDELSFLVQRCDLEPERKQSHFMPYIT